MKALLHISGGIGAVALVAGAIVTPVPAQAQVKRQIWVQNACRYPVRFFIRHADGVRNWHNHGWWTFRPYQRATKLTVADVPIVQQEKYAMYFYAEATGGQGHYWEGKDVRMFNGTRYKMRKAKKVMDRGHYTIKLSCND
ncbi:hypothetical protein GCM10023219_21790 [Stakelama sediminis]|uniref:DUF1036 domain-containing protein n=1 Tax=Stakelama sediminis TaxID=463200 RepID=A0A840YZU0_9SPHN|nr:DUF1036 domain-containing protein [Stakelama sediminis]MBB5719135.1 hypothetical protein [Stakelama sediminis]